MIMVRGIHIRQISLIPLQLLSNILLGCTVYKGIFQYKIIISMPEQPEALKEQISPNEPLKAEMNNKITFVSKSVLVIAIGGFLAHALFDYFFGLRPIAVLTKLPEEDLFPELLDLKRNRGKKCFSG